MKKSLTIFYMLLLSLTGMTQDIHFSQFFEAPLLRNPSLAGIFTGDIRVQAVYRDQWNSVTTAYKTTSLNAEYKLPIGKGSDFITPAIQVLHDRAGTVSWVSTHILPGLNYHKSLNSEKNRYLSVGFMGGLVRRHFDRTKMTTNTMFDGMGDGENFIQPNYTYIDAAAGMSYNSQLGENPDNNFYLGLAYHHFNRPKNSFYRDASAELNPKVVASGGIRFSVTPGSYLTIQTDYSSQGSFRELMGGALYGFKIGPELDNPLYTLHAGLFTRWNDAIIPVIKLDYAPFSFSLSYDVNISNLRTSSYGRGGFELGVSFIAFTRKDNSSINSVLCPKF
jgi:type IX secretion system PorP/SprF family membrane protein